MDLRVDRIEGGHRLAGEWEGIREANAFLGHLAGRNFSTATVRAYAYDLLCFARFLTAQGLGLDAIGPVEIFGWIDAQAGTGTAATARASRRTGAAPASVNRRIAAVRAFYEYQVMTGTRTENPVPSPRRGAGLRPAPQGLLGHLGPGRRRGGGRLVRQPRRLPESLSAADVQDFLCDLNTHRDRAIVLAMVLGGLRAAEIRGLLLADVDTGRRRLRVLGKGGRERVLPVDAAFFAEVTAYLRLERPPGLGTAECFVILRGPGTGRPMGEAALRSVFRRHRASSGATRVRPHRLRHTYGTELAAAGIDLLALRDLMGHVSPQTTAGYVHLSVEHLAAEYAAARASLAGARA